MSEHKKRLQAGEHERIMEDFGQVDTQGFEGIRNEVIEALKDADGLYVMTVKIKHEPDGSHGVATRTWDCIPIPVHHLLLGAIRDNVQMTLDLEDCQQIVDEQENE